MSAAEARGSRSGAEARDVASRSGRRGVDVATRSAVDERGAGIEVGRPGIWSWFEGARGGRQRAVDQEDAGAAARSPADAGSSCWRCRWPTANTLPGPMLRLPWM